MSPSRRKKKYDLEDRTFAFAKRVVHLTKKMRKDVTDTELIKQLVRSAGSVGANYIEANEAISQKDFVYRIKICRKEAKESRYWLRLLDFQKKKLRDGQEALVQEADELTRIFGAILKKST